MPRPRKVIVLPQSQVEDALANGRTTVKELAAAANVPHASMRRYLVEMFGARISFTRGRTGGMHLAPAAPAPTAEVGESTAS